MTRPDYDCSFSGRPSSSPVRSSTEDTPSTTSAESAPSGRTPKTPRTGIPTRYSTSRFILTILRFLRTMKVKEIRHCNRFLCRRPERPKSPDGPPVWESDETIAALYKLLNEMGAFLSQTLVGNVDAVSAAPKVAKPAKSQHATKQVIHLLIHLYEVKFRLRRKALPPPDATTRPGSSGPSAWRRTPRVRKGTRRISRANSCRTCTRIISRASFKSSSRG